MKLKDKRALVTGADSGIGRGRLCHRSNLDHRRRPQHAVGRRLTVETRARSERTEEYVMFIPLHASDPTEPPIPDQPTIPDAPSPGTPDDVPDIGTPEPEPDQLPGRTGD